MLSLQPHKTQNKGEQQQEPKQDQIQSTLHGDTAPFQSLTASITAVASLFLISSCSSRDYRARSSSYTQKPPPSESSVSVASSDLCDEWLNLDWYLDEFSSAGYKPPLTQSQSAGAAGYKESANPPSISGGAAGYQENSNPPQSVCVAGYETTNLTSTLGGAAGYQGTANPPSTSEGAAGYQESTNPPPTLGGAAGYQGTVNPPSSLRGVAGYQESTNPPPTLGDAAEYQGTTNPPSTSGGAAGYQEI